MNKVLSFIQKYDKRTHGQTHRRKAFYNLLTIFFGRRQEITSWFHDRIKASGGKDKTDIDKKKTGGNKTKLEVTRTSQFPGGRSHSWDQQSGRVGEILNMFDILPTQHGKPGNYN